MFGLKLTFLLSLIIYTLGTLIFANTTTYFPLIISAFMIGFHDQMTMMAAVKSIKVFIPEPDGTKYVAYAMTGYAFGPFVWPFFLIRIINPLNLKPDIEYVEQGIATNYFNQEIVSNYQVFLSVQLCLYLIVIGSLIYMFENHPSFPGVFYKYVGMRRKGKGREASVIFRQSLRSVKKSFNSIMLDSVKMSGIMQGSTVKISDSKIIQKPSGVDIELKKKPMQDLALKHVHFEKDKQMDPIIEEPDEEHLASQKIKNVEDAQNAQQVITRPKSQSFDENLIEKDDDDDDIEEQIIQQEIIRDMLSFNFWLIVALGIIRTSTSRYYLSNFKIMGLYYFKDDQKVNWIGSFSYIFYIFQGFTYSKTLDTIGIKNCYALIFIAFVVTHFVYSSMPDSFLLYTALTFIHRVY